MTKNSQWPKNSQWILATALAAVLALPVAAGAETDRPAAAAPAAAPHVAAPAAAPRMAPHIAAPHFAAPHAAPSHIAAPQRAVAPHIAAPQRGVVPHVTPRRDAVHATPHNPVFRAATGEPHHDAATRAAPPAIAAKSQATATTAAQRRADRADRRHEQRELRGLPASQRAAKREEFRKERAARDAQRNPASPENTSVQLNATAQANARAQRRNARRNGGGAITAQAARQGRFASRFAARSGAANANVTRIAARTAWRHHHRAGFVAWYGPVFWPYAYSDIFNYAFWPQGYDEGYWDYAYDDFFDGLFWGEQGAPVAYATSAPEAAQPRVSYASVQELCKQPGSGITAWPFADIERKVGLNAHQKELLNDVRAASSKAAATFKDSCPSEASFPLTPPGRLSSMTARLGATLDAVRVVKPALDTFYNSLSDEQKERFNSLGPSTQVANTGAESTGSAAPAASCEQPKPGLANLPIDKIEEVVAPTDAQEGDLDKLEAATERAVSIMQAACPNETPLTPTGRLGATEQRLQAMIEAANTVKPALDRFYGGLSNEQKARFNHLGQELAQAKD